MLTDVSEAEWYRTVYRGDDVPQLTVRAVAIGAVLGGLMSLSNLYVGLKTGWGLGVAITACILSFAIYRTLRTLFPRVFRTDMSILENNCMQSTASSAGYSTGGTMTSAVAAYLLVTGHHIPLPTLALWTVFLAALGVFLAIPMKRQLINREQLRFPSGVAAAETLKSLHAEGKGAVAQARALGLAGAFGGALTWIKETGKPFSIPGQLAFPGSILGQPLAKWTISFDVSTIMIAAGAIMGWRIAWSIFLGACLNYFVLAPRMVELGAIDASALGYRAIVGWSTWVGAAIMVSGGLMSFALQWRVIGRAFAGFLSAARALVRGAPEIRHEEGNEAIARRIEVPPSWFLAGSFLSGAGCVAVLFFAFGTSVPVAILAVLLTFVLALVACRATGESDITPIGAMGKITQLFFGAVAPSNLVTNLMTAGVTAGAASSSADLLTDLKSGYLLGANPRRQFLAQFLGIFAGTLVVVPAFHLLVPDASALGTAQWPAPAAQVWAAVAKLLSVGIGALHPTARAGLAIGLLVGTALTVLEAVFPRFRGRIPSAMGVGLAMVIPFFNSLSMFLGAGVALVLERKRPKLAESYVVPVSSGLIAGESLLGIVVALAIAAGWIGS